MVFTSISVLLYDKYKKDYDTFSATRNTELNNIISATRESSYLLIGLAIFLLINTIPAVLVAFNCNKKDKIMYSTLAFVFADLYLLQWAIKKFVLKRPNYCPNL